MVDVERVYKGATAATGLTIYSWRRGYVDKCRTRVLACALARRKGLAY